ncbi:HNH endonuclease [Agrobacterium pusense]|uniref:HNH endonuclease n=1 Tax=Agrobacterium pusense TaxID=648995 RepID=UPI002FE2BB5D
MTKVSPAPQEEILRILRYDPEAGLFYRNGQVADCPVPNGYMRVRVLGRTFSSHRLAWFFHTGEWPPHEIDHINGQRADNRIANLRVATTSENQANRKSKVGLKRGVTLHKATGKFQAQIKVSGRNQYLGLFDREEEAHDAYAAAASKHFGSFSKLSQGSPA